MVVKILSLIVIAAFILIKWLKKRIFRLFYVWIFFCFLMVMIVKSILSNRIEIILIFTILELLWSFGAILETIDSH